MTRLLQVFFAVVVVSLCWIVIADGQKPAVQPLPETLRAHLTSERFDVVTSIRGLPLGVREELQKLFGAQTLDIADPGAQFQHSGAGTNQQLPTRRLVAAGCSTDHCLVHYERGGPRPTWHVALFRWTPKATRFEGGGTAVISLATIDKVRDAVISGKIKPASRDW